MVSFPHSSVSPGLRLILAPTRGDIFHQIRLVVEYIGLTTVDMQQNKESEKVNEFFIYITCYGVYGVAAGLLL